MLTDPEDNVGGSDPDSSESFGLLRFLRHPLQFMAAWREFRYSQKASEYLISHPKRGGTSINMARVIEQVIPREL